MLRMICRLRFQPPINVPNQAMMMCTAILKHSIFPAFSAYFLTPTPYKNVGAVHFRTERNVALQ